MSTDTSERQRIGYLVETIGYRERKWLSDMTGRAAWEAAFNFNEEGKPSAMGLV